VVVRSRGVPRREFAVPASAVAGVEDERVRLHLDKGEVHGSPTSDITIWRIFLSDLQADLQGDLQAGSR
jgi:hypothetical protein